MAYHFGKLEIAAKMIGALITNTSTSRNVKDRALELKEQIIVELRNRKKSQ